MKKNDDCITDSILVIAVVEVECDDDDCDDDDAQNCIDSKGNSKHNNNNNDNNKGNANDDTDDDVWNNHSKQIIQRYKIKIYQSDVISFHQSQMLKKQQQQQQQQQQNTSICIVNDDYTSFHISSSQLLLLLLLIPLQTFVDIFLVKIQSLLLDQFQNDNINNIRNDTIVECIEIYNPNTLDYEIIYLRNIGISTTLTTRTDDDHDNNNKTNRYDKTIVQNFGKRIRVRVTIKKTNQVSITTTNLQTDTVLSNTSNSSTYTTDTVKLAKNTKIKAICGRYFGHDIGTDSSSIDTTVLLSPSHAAVQDKTTTYINSCSKLNTSCIGTSSISLSFTSSSYLIISQTGEQKQELQQYKLYFSERINEPNSTTGYNVWDGSILMARYLEGVCNNNNDCRHITKHNIDSNQDGCTYTITSSSIHGTYIYGSKSDDETLIQQQILDDHNQQQQQEQQYQVLREVRNMALIIELGSGCGVAGISASALGASNVIVTDLPDVIPLLQSNIDQNMSTIINQQQQQQQQQQKRANEYKEDEEIVQTGRLAACECDWTRPLSDTFKSFIKSSLLQQSTQQPIQQSSQLLPVRNGVLILISDCIWMEDLIDPLLDTIQTIIDYILKITTTMSQSHSTTIVQNSFDCTPSIITILFTYQRRGKSTDARFWESLHCFMRHQFVSSTTSLSTTTTTTTCNNNECQSRIHVVDDPNYLKQIGVYKPDNFYVISCSIPVRT